MKKETVYIIIAIIVIYGIIYYLTSKDKYYKYFRDQLGFGETFLDTFTGSELKAIYEYLRDYPRKGKILTYQADPVRYNKMIAIDNRHGHFLDLPLS